jgi:Ethanolamine utilization protein EutJ (predicted chaperonin)
MVFIEGIDLGVRSLVFMVEDIEGNPYISYK